MGRRFFVCANGRSGDHSGAHQVSEGMQIELAERDGITLSELIEKKLEKVWMKL